MIPEFQSLSEKINQLAELTLLLRQENADLRLRMAVLTTENAELSKRMQEASQRLAALLEIIPATPAPTPSFPPPPSSLSLFEDTTA